MVVRRERREEEKRKGEGEKGECEKGVEWFADGKRRRKKENEQPALCFLL